MKIYVLEEYNTGRTACISENVNIVRKQMCNKEFSSPEYNDFPILTIWENGIQIEDIDDMREYLVWEAQGMRPNYRIEDCPE